MASLSEGKETRSPTPDTLVEDFRVVDNVNDKALESAEGSIKDRPQDNLDQPVKEEGAIPEEEVEYASGIKLGFIVIALALSIFLVCHSFVLRTTLVQSLTDVTGL